MHSTLAAVIATYGHYPARYDGRGGMDPKVCR